MESGDIESLNLSQDEVTKIQNSNISLDEQTFLSNYLLGKSQITTHNIINLTTDTRVLNYISKLVDWVNEEDNPYNWIMELDCKISLVNYSRWLIQYPPELSHLCQVPLSNMRKCYQRPVRDANIILAKNHVDFTF